MSQNGFTKNTLFSFFYRSRIKVTKGSVSIVNLSLLFSVVSLLCAPWLVVIGCFAALALGYGFSFEKNASDFDKSWQTIVQDATETVKSAAETFQQDAPSNNEPPESNEQV